MTLRLAINGFGRIGEMALRHVLADQNDGDDKTMVVAINDIVPLDQISYLLRHDSVHRHSRCGHDIRSEPGLLLVDERRIPVFQERDPSALPWADMAVDIVIESSGAFTTRDGMGKHIQAGARRVLLTAPAKKAGDVDATLCIGVNEGTFEPSAHRLVSNASCTTNCLAPVARALDEAFGLEWGMMSTIHAYTGSQALIDAAQRKLRRGRAAALNIVPTTTGAARAIGLVLPHLDGRVDGMAYRVPVAAGSAIDLVFQTERPFGDAESLVQALRTAAGDPSYRGVLDVSDDELVSSDIIGTRHSAIVDAASTRVMNERTAAVMAWYDNEWAYARRVVDVARHMGAALAEAG